MEELLPFQKPSASSSTSTFVNCQTGSLPRSDPAVRDNPLQIRSQNETHTHTLHLTVYNKIKSRITAGNKPWTFVAQETLIGDVPLIKLFTFITARYKQNIVDVGCPYANNSLPFPSTSHPAKPFARRRCSALLEWMLSGDGGGFRLWKSSTDFIRMYTDIRIKIAVKDVTRQISCRLLVSLSVT